MKISVNGKSNRIDEKTSILDLLKRNGVKVPSTVSVQLNGQIIAVENYETSLLKDNDTVEFLYFVGGGRS